MKHSESSTTPVTRKPDLAAVFSRPAFGVLLASEAVSLIGDRILMIVLINLVYERSGSAAAVGLLSMIKALPALVLATLAGVFVDRWSRKWTMVISNLILFALVFTFSLSDSLAVLFVIYFCMSIVSQFFVPARSASIPALVPEQALMAANALFAMAFVGAIAIGPALGGWIAERYSIQAAFTIDALTFLVPAVAVSFLSIPQSGQTRSGESLWKDWSDGFKQLKAAPELRNALLMVGAVALLIATLSTLGVVVVRERLGGGAGDFGWMMSIAGAGMLASALANSLLGKHFERQRLAIGGTLLGGGAMITLSLANSMPLVMAAGFLLGLGFVTVQINVQTTLQRVPDEIRGRMQGFAQAVMGSVTFLAAGLAGVLAAWISPTGVLLGSGLLATVTGLSIFWFTRHTKIQGGEDELHSSNR